MGRTGTSRLGIALVALVAAAAGCSSARYVYRPEENAMARVSGHTAAYYDVPPQSPHGDVRVATLGIATLEPQDEEGERIHAMHVRLVVANNDDVAPWQLDTRQQIGSLDHDGQSRPAFATASIGRPPIVTIARGASATIDLYYPLPESMQKASKVPHFEVLWRVQTPEGAVAERTTFERLRIEPPPAPGYDAWEMGWWGPGWYDPFWPDDAFWGAPVLGPMFYGGPVVVGPPAELPPAAQRVR